MQTNTNSLSKILLGFLLMFTSVCGVSQENYVWPVKLQKDYTKTYPVGSETVALMNRYGKMTIETWDRNEVKVDAHITVGAQTNEYATRILDKISIGDEKKSDRIEFVTKLVDWSNPDDYNGGHEMRIDYTVHIPANGKLYAENNFGPLTIGDYKGEAELLCKYGTLTAGKLSNAKNITVEFGKAMIESISDSKLLFRYSRIDIAKIAGNIQGQFDFCNSIDMPVDNSLKKLELKNSYTSLYLVVPKDFSADYDITTNNARVTAKYDMVIKEEQAANTRTNSFSPNHHYLGSFGRTGGTQINIKSNFGNVRVM